LGGAKWIPLAPRHSRQLAPPFFVGEVSLRQMRGGVRRLNL
jgi:hypothetical protein